MLSELPDKAQSLVVSYLAIRKAIGISGFLLPVLLGPVGWLVWGIDIQDNISSYYHTELRDVFVGTLCAIGVFLYCYRGYDSIENWTANVGCVSALGVAFFPLDPHSDPLYQRSVAGYLHTLSGGVFFLVLAFYSLFHFPRAGKQDEQEGRLQAERNFIYRTSGIVILLSMAAMGAYLFLLPAPWKSWLNHGNFLFWMEWIAVWAFAAAWLTKGKAIVAEVAVELMAIPHAVLTKQKWKGGGSD